MSIELPRLFLVRHGNTAWSEQHKHTGRTDVPLNEHGEQRARELDARLRGCAFTAVFTSPLQRAARTCELAGFGNVASTDGDLVEWDYGQYEGLLTEEIVKQRPGWNLFRDGCPAGESPADVAARADRFIRRVRALSGDVLAFSSGHVIRMIAARWLGLPAEQGRCFDCQPASIGLLSFEHHNFDEPIIELWNYEGRIL